MDAWQFLTSVHSAFMGFEKFRTICERRKPLMLPLRLPSCDRSKPHTKFTCEGGLISLAISLLMLFT